MTIKSSRKVPADFNEALSIIPKAKATWSALTPIAKRDFIAWIESAKQPQTRERRIDKACTILLAGKRRPCCYAVVPIKLYKALSKNPKAKAKWKSLSAIEKRDLIDWIEAVKGEQNSIRVEKALSSLAQSKSAVNIGDKSSGTQNV